MIRVLPFVLFLFFPLICYAVDPYSFSVSEFEYEKGNKTKKTVTEKSPAVKAKPQSSTSSNISIDGSNMIINTPSVYVIHKGQEGIFNADDKLSQFKIKTSLSYWIAADNDWQKALNPVFLADIGVIFPEVRKSDLFAFTFGASLFYRLSLSKDKYNLVFNALGITLPLNFKFNIAQKHKLTFSIGPYYELEFLLYEDRFNSKSNYEQNVFGIKPQIYWLVNVKRDLDIGLEVSGIIPFTRGAFSSVSAGVVLEWII